MANADIRAMCNIFFCFETKSFDRGGSDDFKIDRRCEDVEAST